MKRLTVTLSVWRGKEGDQQVTIERDAEYISVDRTEDRMVARGFARAQDRSESHAALWQVGVTDYQSFTVDTLPEETNAG